MGRVSAVGALNFSLISARAGSASAVDGGITPDRTNIISRLALATVDIAAASFTTNPLFTSISTLIPTIRTKELESYLIAYEAEK